MSNLRHLSEDDLTALIAQRDRDPSERVRGSVVGTRREGVSSSCTPNASSAIGGKERGGNGQAGSNPAPSPTFLYTLALTGQLPSGKNQVQLLWRNGKVLKYPNTRFTNWRAVATVQILEQTTRPIGRLPTITVPVCLTCEYWPGDHRTRDVSGMLDALFHLLVYTKVLQDDGLVYDVTWRRHAMNRRCPKVVMAMEAWR